MNDDISAPSTRLLRATAAVLGVGGTIAAIFVLGRVSGSLQEHGVYVLVAGSVGVLGLWYLLRNDAALRAWSVGSVATTLLVAAAVGGLLSRPSEVNEQVVSAEPAASGEVMVPADEAMTPDDEAMEQETPARNMLVASGRFEALAHAGRGTASIIRTSEGRDVLTLTDFTTDAGPDLFVWLVAGDPADDSAVESGRHVSVGALKGTSGDQQYVLPDGVDPADFSHAYVWCRAFSVGFTRARLA